MRRLIVDLFRINIAKLSIPVPICDVEAHPLPSWPRR